MERKEASYEIGAVERKIEEEVAEFVGAPMKAKPEVAGGGLTVKIQSRYPWRDEMPSSLDDQLPDPQAYDDSVEVTVELTQPDDGYSTFGDSKYTDKGGEVTWNQIPAGTYTITVSTPEGYRVASYSTSECGEEAGEPEEASTPPLIQADVCDDETTTIEVFLLPLLSAVDVLCFYDQDRSGDPSRKGQTAITSLSSSFRMQGKPIVAHSLGNLLGKASPNRRKLSKHPISHLLGPALVQALAAHPDHPRVYLLWKTGTVAVITDSPVLATFPGRSPISLQTESPNGTFTYLSRGQLAAAFVGYEAAEAEIQVAAFLEEECACDPCHPTPSGRPAIKRTPLPGVTFQLYLGSPQGEPYQQATTIGSAPHLFTNLPPATNYYMIASAWPTSFGGATQIQPRPASGVSGPHSVSAAFPTKIDFCFASCLSRVTGIVTEGQAGMGVPNVPVLLALSGGSQCPPFKATSNAKGEYEFNNVPAGNYLVQIEKEKIFLGGGKVLEVPASAQTGYAITVPACGTVSAPVIQLNDDVHRIFGTATAPDGSILQFLRIEIQDQSGNVKAVTQTDANGQYQVLLPQAGFYLVVPQINDAPQIPVQVNSEVQIDIQTAPSGSPASKQAASRASQVQESEVDLQAYPILTEEVPSDVVSRPPSAGGGTGIAPIGKMAENAIRDVLSWRAKTDDPKSFLLALNQSFALTEVEGHTEFKWTPRTYTVQTDMGAITGAQASIYNRAKVALDQSLPLLDGLYALLPVLEQEDLDSTRDMVKSLFTELVNDLGIEGGPRIPRVDQLFRLLIGHPVPVNSEAANANSQLGILRQRFNLKREFITTIADEQNLTNYLIVVDYLIGLNNSWINEKKFFAHSGTTAQPYFGTQLVLLSRSLDVVAQAVKDVEFAMDSVFISAAERQTTLLDFSSIDPESSLFIAELLDWVDRAASVELPAQLQDSGKDAINTVKDVAGDLHRFVRASMLPNQPLKGLPPGYRTPRVQRALRLLAESLSETLRLASQIKAPAFPIETGRIPPALI